jgi:carbonic anhydrase/acetyltransferase-like protein (isoleucine patch superfamily)
MSEHPEYPHRYIKPKIESSVFVAPGAHVIGDVQIGKESSIWFNTVVRGDVNFVRIGERTNIQDCSLIHESYKTHPCIIGDDVTVGHSVILHACTVGNFSLIGMGSIVLDAAEIGEFVLLGAGSLVTQGTKIPSFSKAFGRPAKVVGKLTEEEIERLKFSAAHYVQLASTYLKK